MYDNQKSLLELLTLVSKAAVDYSSAGFGFVGQRGTSWGSGSVIKFCNHDFSDPIISSHIVNTYTYTSTVLDKLFFCF